MYVFVLDSKGSPLMPCHPVRARQILRKGRARVVRVKPFTIQLMDRENGNTQPIYLGQDPGLTQGIAAVRQDGTVLLVMEIKCRTDVSDNLLERKGYRRGRRYRNTGYRHARFLNRSKSYNWLPPSIRHLKHEHDKVRVFIKSILPITGEAVEINKFDFQKMENPSIKGKEYQNGPQKGFFDVREYVLYRDGYACVVCDKDVQREMHRVIWRFRGGTDKPKNLVTLCKSCHEKIEKGELKYGQIYKNYIWAARINMLRNSWNGVVNVITGDMVKTRNCLNLEKSHTNDALSVCLSAFSVAPDTDSIRNATSLKGRFVRRKNRKLHDANPKEGGYREPYNVNRYLVNKTGIRFCKGDLVEYVTKQGNRIDGYINTLFSRGTVRITNPLGKELYNGASINKVRKLQNATGLLLAA